MKLTADETCFLTALVREQNQSGCRGPAHDLLRQHAYPDSPPKGPGSLSFSYDAVPLTAMLFQTVTDLDALDEFLRRGARVDAPAWPWASVEQYRVRLEEARAEWTNRRPLSMEPRRQGTEDKRPSISSPATKQPQTNLNRT